jgi:hypothetical protein
MRGYVFIAILLAFGVRAQVLGQSARDDAFFRGTVVDAVSMDPIPFVTINTYRPDNVWPGASDFDGAFFIRCPKNWMFVEVRMKGYATQYVVVDISSGWVETQIMLVPNADGSQ